MGEKLQKFEADDSINTKVAKCVSALEANGMVVPTRIAGISDLPVNDFDHLRQQLQDRSLLLQKRFSSARELWIEQTVTEPHESCGVFTAFPIGAIVTAVGALALAIGVSWWFLFALILVPLQLMGFARKASWKYDQKVLRAASGSETAFCMLYRVGQICLTTPDYKTDWHWESD